MKKLMSFISMIFLMLPVLFSCERTAESETVKIGLLHSFTGSMAVSECPLKNAELLAVREINGAGGVLGCKIEIVEEDGESDAKVFAAKARKLIEEDSVAAIFGCWTSASRKAVKPVVEDFYSLLWYPVQYEGMEASPNIMYMGAAPNQQIVPAISFCAEQFGKRMFLVGSDYIFPRTANRIIKAELADIKGEACGEEYVPLDASDFTKIVEKIKVASPDVIINTINGISNKSFFEELKRQGITAEKIPVMSFSIAEEEVSTIGAKNLAGQYVSWNYFYTMQNEENRRFIRALSAAFGRGMVTSDPMEAAYIAIHMWAKACEKAGSFETEKVRIAVKNMEFEAPEGEVILDGYNQHLYKKVRIGKIGDTGIIEEVWVSPEQVKPDPYLSSYAWARGLYK